MWQLQEGIQPSLLQVAEELDLGPVVGAADDGQCRNQKDDLQGIPCPDRHIDSDLTWMHEYCHRKQQGRMNIRPCPEKLL